MSNPHKHIMVIKPRRGISASRALEVIKYISLIKMLAVRDLRIRYKQSILGFAWAIIRPVAQMVVFTLIFGKLLGVDEMIGDIPYAIFVYAALLPWMLFASSVSACSNSLLQNNAILSKVYVPRLVFPASSLGVPLIDFLISLVILIGLMFWYQQPIHLVFTLIVPLSILTCVIALGIGMIVASLGVWYRDFLFTITFILQIWQFISPVMYPLDRIPAQYQWIVALNPMYGVIEAFRACIVHSPVNYSLILISLGVGTGILITGFIVFLLTEKKFVDKI